MAKKTLRAVEDGELPERELSVEEAAESGSHLSELIAIRRVIARAIDNPNTMARDLAALTRRQLEVSREIAAARIEEAEEATANNVVTEERWRPAAI